jgi:streptogramin lyase
MKKSFFAVIASATLLITGIGINPASAGASVILGTTGSTPYAITVDSAGNVYTANLFSRNVSKITPAGVSTILGTTGDFPISIVIDSAGNLYVPSFLANNVTKITPAGVSTILGTTGFYPNAITIDSAGNVYTADNGSNTVSKITPDGTSIYLGTTGSAPIAITIDSAGNVYTANEASNNVSKITPGGSSSILGTTGSSPYAITIDSAGNIYTANRQSNNVSKITPAGVSTVLGTTGNTPRAITIDNAGNIYTANYGSNNVSKITPAGVSTIVGTTGNGPSSIAIDSAGNIYTGNQDSNNVSKIVSTTVPDAPTIGIATSLSPTSASVTFSAPVSNGGATIETYTATSSPGSITGRVLQAGSGTITMSGLTSSTAYTFRVTASNSVGTSSVSSATVSITTPASAEEIAVQDAAAVVAAALAAKAAVIAAVVKREADRRIARTEILAKYKKSESISIELFAQAEIAGITKENIKAVQAEIAALPEVSRADITQVLKVARKYEVVGLIASDRVVAVYSNSLIEIGLIPEDSEHKAALTEAIKNLPEDERSSYAAIKEALNAKMAEIQARKDRLTAILGRIAAHRAS